MLKKLTKQRKKAEKKTKHQNITTQKVSLRGES